MQKRFALVLLAGLVGFGLTGCPADPYSAKTWTKKLDDPRESERAVTELEQLGDPSAIPALGEAWAGQGKPVRMLQVIISLARPLTPEEAKAKYATDYETTGRKASWDAALPFLTRALTEVDEANPRSVDSAAKAADALGEAGLSDGLDALVDIASKPVTKKLIAAQVGAIRAIGKFDGEKARAAAALTKIIDREPPPHPKTAKDKEQGRSLEEKYGLFLGVTGAAINALGDLRVGSAAKTLALSMYRTPELFVQIRRALVATGPTAKDELRKILRGESAEVNQLFKDKRLDKYCGDKGDAPQDQCQPVSAKDFYPAVVLGDFYDPAATPDLLAALKRPAVPVYFMDDQPSPNTQYNAIFDALRKIGAADAAAPVRAMWAGGGGAAPKKGQPAPPPEDLNTKILAISAYPFLTRDGAGTEALGAIAADNKADDTLRQEAATAFARLSNDPKDLNILEDLAKKYFDASAAKKKEADGKPKAEADAADKVFEAKKKEVEKAKSDLLKFTHDTSKTAADIKAATAATKKVEDGFKEAKKVHKAAVAPYKNLENAAKAYKGYARMFQTHIARIEIAVRCKQDINCYAASLKIKPDEAAKNNAKYIKDIKDWSEDEKKGLAEAGVERAMLEIGKQGAKAASLTDTLLDAAKSDVRLVRQSVLLALPKIAKLPCSNCEDKLDAAIKAGEGKTTLGDLNLETTMLRNYFSWAGGKTPSAPTPEKAEAPAEK
ncbi:MAG: hypothetical protein H0T46_34190 [Deltaproteobacteria bacterium]|nr:hypothetical protein [Deltaproteobacteria bacterium]